MEFPVHTHAPGGSAPEDPASSTAAGADTTTNTNTNTNTNDANTAPANTSSRRRRHSRHVCGMDDCTFTSETPKGIREHQKNKHLGTECYWLEPDDEFCGFTTRTHEELYEHFNQVHLRGANQRGPPYQCCWPGNPGIPIPGPGGSAVAPENPCEQAFQHVGSADRHAREHQHKIWRALDNVVWPVAHE
ncbi:hypothetical protein F4859DRAFT_517518 [Xylaria cf. heliscus]|nr:hypothetical protein F4859DRAFT_517518 [Xylaria cf. heliscus]